MMSRPTPTTTIKDGQEFFDEPVYELPKPVAGAVNAAYQRSCPRYAIVAPKQNGTQRVRLLWMRPDGNGGLVPRNQRG